MKCAHADIIFHYFYLRGHIAYHIYCNIALKNLLKVNLCFSTLSASFLYDKAQKKFNKMILVDCTTVQLNEA